MIWSRLIACLLQKTNHPDRNLSVMADFFRYSWILQRGERVFNLGVDTKKGWNLKLFNDILRGSFGKISGHGITLGGIIVNSGNFGWKASGKTTLLAIMGTRLWKRQPRRPLSPISMPFFFAIKVQLFPTSTHFCFCRAWNRLSLRLERHAENTKKMMDYLDHHPQVEKVNHLSLPAHPNHALYTKYFPNGGASIFTF